PRPAGRHRQPSGRRPARPLRAAREEAAAQSLRLADRATRRDQTQDGQRAYRDLSAIRPIDRTLADLELIDRVGDYHGVMPLNGMTRLTDITDGTSNTVLVAEAAGRPESWRTGRLVPGEIVSGGGWAGDRNRLVLMGAT